MNIIVLDFTIFSPFLRVLTLSLSYVFCHNDLPVIFFLYLYLCVCVARAALCVERNVGSTPLPEIDFSLSFFFLVRRSLFLSLLLDLEVRVSSIAGALRITLTIEKKSLQLFSTAADGQLRHPCT